MYNQQVENIQIVDIYFWQSQFFRLYQPVNSSVHWDSLSVKWLG